MSTIGSIKRTAVEPMIGDLVHVYSRDWFPNVRAGHVVGMNGNGPHGHPKVTVKVIHPSPQSHDFVIAEIPMLATIPFETREKLQHENLFTWAESRPKTEDE